MRILALIPARGGSKRVPGKNVRKLGGKPLITWSIDVVRGIAAICDVIVSTDDRTVAAVAESVGVRVPWLRPAELATDTATSVDVALHALAWYEAESGRVDGLLLLQPTSPFRRRDTVLQGIELFRAGGRRPVVGVSPARSHPLHCFEVVDGAMRPFAGGDVQSRTQDLPKVYEANGAFYLVTPEYLRAQRSFYGDAALPLIVDDPRESIDIDTEWDWQIAEAALSHRTSQWTVIR